MADAMHRASKRCALGSFGNEEADSKGDIVMSDPVVLIGQDVQSKIGAIGLYESIEAAKDAVQNGDVPSALFYSVHTPAIGTISQPKEISQIYRLSTGERSDGR